MRRMFKNSQGNKQRNNQRNRSLQSKNNFNQASLKPRRKQRVKPNLKLIMKVNKWNRVSRLRLSKEKKVRRDRILLPNTLRDKRTIHQVHPVVVVMKTSLHQVEEDLMTQMQVQVRMKEGLQMMKKMMMSYLDQNYSMLEQL